MNGMKYKCEDLINMRLYIVSLVWETLSVSNIVIAF